MPYDPRDPRYFDAAAVLKEQAPSPSSATAADCVPPSTTCWTKRWTGTTATTRASRAGTTARSWTSAGNASSASTIARTRRPTPGTSTFRGSCCGPRPRAQAEGVTRTDAWLGNVDAVGSLGSALAPLANFANRFAPSRAMLEAAFGIDRHRNLSTFHHNTFARWFRERGGGRVREGRKVAFFHSCSINYNEPQVGRDAVSVLERNGCAVHCPEQVCCGMPYLDGGDLGAATATPARTSRRSPPSWTRARRWWCRSPPARTS